MTDLIEKARQGRTNALAGLAMGAGKGVFEGAMGARFRSTDRHEKVIFTSLRARHSTGGALI